MHTYILFVYAYIYMCMHTYILFVYAYIYTLCVCIHIYSLCMHTYIILFLYTQLSVLIQVPHYYRNVHAVVYVYDMTNRETFLSLKGWLTEYSRHSLNNDQVPRVLIGEFHFLSSGSKSYSLKHISMYRKIIFIIDIYSVMLCLLGKI